ncbi:MAG: hypothetical protein FD180_1812 [Planctomycetota bacterium]|nr:MAG: hypothetical protein FD180_1812 [Planctomycetota bacterium]
MNYLTPAEVADRLRLHVVSVRAMLAAGRLGAAVKIGRVWRLPEDELQRAVERMRVTPPCSGHARTAFPRPDPKYVAMVTPRGGRQ